MNDLFSVIPESAIGGFEEFYARYPRKVGKGQARKAYAKAVRIARHDDIMFGLSQQIDAMQATEKQFIPHPATWLNGERWDDEVEQPHNNGGKAPNGGGMGRPTVANQIGELAIRRARNRLEGGQPDENA